MSRYECDKCGACCNGSLIVEADEIDVLREPRLIEADRHYAELGAVKAIELLRNDIGRAVIISCGTACPFLNPENLCSIHPTRPNVCVAFEAGDEQCQEVRAAHGLPPLPPLP
jgi:Fe-S-cluster containining protein